MCGIAGLLAPWPREKIQAHLERMVDSLSHRGPDDRGLHAQDGFGFGMRRLSIIDLDTGNQPMWDQASGLGLVYNGELYNYRDLRRGLEERGESFATTSDTEVLLKSLARQGLKAVGAWNAMFGVAAWDPRGQTLTLLRDRLGKKPLYYHWDGQVLLFGSEVKAILASGLVTPRLSRQALWDYLTFRYIPQPQSIWENIVALAPGACLTLKNGQHPRLTSFWDNDQPKGQASAEPLADFTDLFRDTVKLRMEASDVPVGILLSGGLDSSAVAATALALGHCQVNTYSVDFSGGAEFSELAYARQVARHIGSRHHELTLDRATFMERLPYCLAMMDEPLADLTMVPFHELCRLARQDVKVLLGGEGADEVLGGYTFQYDAHLWQRVARLQRLPPWLLKATARAVGEVLPNGKRELLEQAARVPLLQWNLQNLPIESKNFLQDEKEALWPGFAGQDSLDIPRQEYGQVRYPTPLGQMLAVYQKSWLEGDPLRKSDRMSMAASLELRLPFLDYRLVEWANAQPDEVKVVYDAQDGYDTKRVLRQYASQLLPRAILERPKQGFPLPCYRWLEEDDTAAWALERLTGPHSRLAGVFSKKLMATIVEQARLGWPQAPQKTWILLVLDIWLEAQGAQLD
ncbi:MAG: asparagine synthase (glutamine-hydrolyzing) [Desulfarculus sp.]|nr:asparagine synthase (glutamine-hydrolyzing) [Desulfarculus sp.]